jgi:hypothetical protein
MQVTLLFSVRLAGLMAAIEGDKIKCKVCGCEVYSPIYHKHVVAMQ